MHRGGKIATAVLAATIAMLAVVPAAGARIAYFTGADDDGAEPYAQAIELTNASLGTEHSFSGEGEPRAVAITPDGRTAYVVDQFGEGILPIDVATDTAGTEIPTGPSPTAIAIAPNGSAAYVADRAEGVVRVDLAKAEATDVYPLSGEPRGIAIVPDGSTAYVTGTAANTVTPIELGTGTPGTPIEVGEGSSGIGIAPDGSAAYVTNGNDDDVSRIGLPSGIVTKTIPVENSPEAIAVTPDSSRAYVVGSNSPITPIDLTTGTAGTGIPVGGQGNIIGGVAILPDGSRAYVTDNSAGQILPIAIPSDLLETGLPANNRPHAIAIVPNQGPVASFTPTPAAAEPGATIAFDGAGSSDSDGTVARYDWDFGDGDVAANGGATPGHAYAAAGTYTVTLTVTDNEGCSTAIVFPGQTAYCNGSAAARTTRQVTISAPETPTTPASGGTKAKKKKKRKVHCPAIAATATSFVPKVVPGNVVPGVRVRLAANQPVKVVVKPTLAFTRHGRKHSVALATRSAKINNWRRIRLAVPRGLRRSLHYGRRVRVRLRIAVFPRRHSKACSGRVVHRSLTVRVVKVFPNAVQRGRLR